MKEKPKDGDKEIGIRLQKSEFHETKDKLLISAVKSATAKMGSQDLTKLEWDPERRQAFANDMSIPESLIAVSASSNRSKGARDPAEWLPPRQEFHCQYVDAWTEVKKLWNLSMDQAEYDAITEVRANC